VGAVRNPIVGGLIHDSSRLRLLQTAAHPA
jgi:hypothetical protein